MIIDCHTHFPAGDSVYREEDVERCLALANRAGIDHLVYLFNTADGAYDPPPDVVVRNNDLGIELATRHPDRFSAFCYLNPAHDVAFLEREMQRCLIDGPCVGIKLWIAVKATDARLDPIMLKAAELGVPVLHHAWYKATEYVFNESTPAEIAHLARRHPETTIIMAHLAGGGERGVLDVRDCPNVLVDTSGAQPVAGLVRYAVDQLGPDRVIFGSDWPIRDFGVQRARVESADLPDAVKARILGGTMQRVLERARR
ncbi:MAG TPA: amidohydrolase family protein [Thermomicrobiales bacterium]|nr:amidohydrolase family protein [Thermomicrobiales bacterium]